MAVNHIGEISGLLEEVFSTRDGLKRVLETLLEAGMDQEVAAHVGANRHERASDRRGYRNGTKPRRLKTRAGELELSVPQTRDCDRLPQFGNLSVRFYQKAAEKKAVDLDWKDYLFQSCSLNQKMALALTVLRDKTITKPMDRVSKFSALCGGSRATFFRYQDELRRLYPELNERKAVLAKP